MLKKINDLANAACIKGKLFVRELKNDQRGLSGVVVAVLLILVAVLAVVMIWGFLSDWLTELWDIITGKASGLG